MRQLGELLIRLDRRSYAGLLSTLEKFVERYPSLAGETGSQSGGWDWSIFPCGFPFAKRLSA